MKVEMEVVEASARGMKMVLHVGKGPEGVGEVEGVDGLPFVEMGLVEVAVVAEVACHLACAWVLQVERAMAFFYPQVGWAQAVFETFCSCVCAL